MYKIINYLVIVFFLIGISNLEATQRMGVAPGHYKIKANNSSKINAYCLDHSRKAPSSENKLTNILSSPQGIVVKIGNKTISMEEAIDKNYVEIVGNSPTPNDLLMRVKKENPKSYNEILKLPKEEKTLIFEGLNLNSIGDHTTIQFKNNTDYAIEIISKNPMVFGETEESIDDINLSLIKNAKSKKEQENNQRQIWNTRNESTIKLLKELGHHKEKVKIEDKKEIEKVVSEFQRKRKLKDDGIADDITTKQLQSAKEILETTKKFSPINSHYNYMTIEYLADSSDNSQKPIYALYNSQGKEIICDEYDKIIIKASEEISRANENNKTTYLNLDKLKKNKADGIIASINLYTMVTDGLKIIDNEIISTEDRDSFFIEPYEGVTNKPTITAKDNGYESEITVQVRSKNKFKNFVITIFSKSNQYVTEFLNFFMKNNPEKTLAQRVHYAKKELKLKYKNNFSDEDLKIKIISESGNTFFGIKYRGHEIDKYVN